MSFSDRLGITQPRSILQVESMDKDLRNGLWQACIEWYLRKFDRHYSDDHVFQTYVFTIYVDFLKVPADTIPYGHEAPIEELRSIFFGAPWYQVYNFIEFLIENYKSKDFVKRVTFFLEREKSGYRVVDNRLVPITDPNETAAVAEAAVASNKYSGAREHIRAAIELFSRKPQPDYRNSVKESISAVESVARVITGNPKATLGDALKSINEKMPIHSALRDAMSKLYGYTSDEGGIRHSLLEAKDLDEAEAKFMIVACSAFVNFCIQRST
ncbi:AbiJ-NTD4 domain-containing protein [Bradyrhizobium sp. USDA 4506]